MEINIPIYISLKKSHKISRRISEPETVSYNELWLFSPSKGNAKDFTAMSEVSSGPSVYQNLFINSAKALKRHEVRGS